MHKLFIVATVVALTLPLVGAQSATGEELQAIGVPGVGTYYVAQGNAEAQLWEETNAAPGLQRDFTQDDGGNTIPPDTRHI